MLRLPVFFLAVCLMPFVAASAATDLQRAKALNRQINQLFASQPDKTFEGDKGKAYCAWLQRIRPIQSELLDILLRNPKLVGIGSKPVSHEEAVQRAKINLLVFESDGVQCATSEFLEEMEIDEDELDRALDE